MSGEIQLHKVNEEAPKTNKQNKFVLKFKQLFAGQRVWLVWTLLVISTLLYYEITEVRIFDSTSTEHFKPSLKGGHGHNSRLYHK